MLTLTTMMVFSPSSYVFAQMSASEHASHHQGNSGSQVSTSAPEMETETETNKAAPTPTTSEKTTIQPSEHALHHPGNNTAGSNPMAQMMAPSSTPPGPPGCCGLMASGGKPFYASLMDFPTLSDSARKYIRSEALARLGTGAELITATQAELHHALSTNNLIAAQAALRKVRQGLFLAESGASALQALNEAQPPPHIALNWFKQEMNISENPTSETNGSGSNNISWFHLIAMLILAAALITAFIFRWARLRRISSLIQRLTPSSEAIHAPITVENPIASPKKAEATTAPIQRPWSGILRVKAIFDETPHVKTFRLMEPNLATIPFTFLPGQYATLTSEINGEKVRRSYTISSSPTQRDYIELTVKREQYGLESRHLHDHTSLGDLLEVTAPAGNFFFTGKEANGIVLIAGGVGITPMMSVLRYLTDRAYPRDVHLLYAVNSPSDIIFREEYAYLTRRHHNVHVDIIALSTEGSPWTGPVGLITANFIVTKVPDIANHRIHLCGPLPMMDAVKTILQQLKIPTEQIKTENFAPPKGGPVTTTEPSNLKTTPRSDTASDHLTSPQVPSAQATILFSRSNKSGPIAPDQSVLEAAEAIGVAIDYECRTGICGRCKVPLLKGTVTMEIEDSLSPDEKANGIILACQAKTPNDLVVEA